MVVFDGSGSMSEMGFNDMWEARIVEARRAVRRSIPQVAPFRRLGLIVYGPGSNEDCSNITVRFPPQAQAADRMIAEIDAMQPMGPTPLTSSVLRAAEVLNYREQSGVVVLVTDGKETCGGSPCYLAALLAADGLDLTVHVIGFKVRGDYFNWNSQGGDEKDAQTTVARCLADRTGGKYLSTETVDELAAAFQETLGCALIGHNHALRIPFG
ncbi:VWA domain-containing protein [Actibacterium sp. 188UL27-1]|nr:VWA domain-containing protein [Actibacterium sp. 188UL27-1]